ncbi:MAG TPA: MMPL family transporter [Candidatus Binataceae bacterium]|nr:MMPL family transporter [Candidatus Binataceae bacterium]
MSFRYRVFRGLARLDFDYPWQVLLGCTALALLAVLYTRTHLQFQTGQEDLISDHGRDTSNYRHYENEFPDLDSLIVVVRADRDPARAERFADTFAARLAADPDNVKSVLYKIDAGALANRALLYLSSEDLGELTAHIRDYRPFLSAYAADPSLNNFFALTNGEANRAMTSAMVGSLFGDQNPPADSSKGKLNLALVDAMLNGMLARGNFASPWDDLTSVGPTQGVLRDGYIASENGKYLIMNVVRADGREGAQNPIDAIDAHLAAVREQFPGVEAGMTGGPALARTEATSTAHDIALASLIAIVSNVLLVVIPFGGIVEPAFALTALLIGVAWSFGFTALAIGHLNLLSAVFTSILAGIGINFPIHLMARYDEARGAGRITRESIELGVVNTGAGVVASACIMALAFLMPIFSDFKGIAELGIVSAGGLFLCLLSAMLVFPSLLVIRDRRRPPHLAPSLKLVEREPWLPRLFARPGLTVAMVSAATLIGLLAVRGVRFDQNLLKLQAESTEAVHFEELLLKDSGRSSWFAVSLNPTREEALHKAELFSKLRQVADAETIATYVPAEQARKRAMLDTLRPILMGLKVSPPGPPSDPALLRRELAALNFKLAGARDSDPSGAAAHTAELTTQAIARLDSDAGAFVQFEKEAARGFSLKLAQFRGMLDPSEITVENLPAELRNHFIGRSGIYLVQIYPRGDVWEDIPLARFIGALRSIDSDVTGAPVQAYSIATVMRRGYERAALLALVAVFVFVFADFRNLRDTVLATVPLLFGGAWLLATMGLLGWEFNLANLFAVPIIIGTGVDNGVNMLYRWREERDKSRLILTTAVGKSVTIASLTTIAGFAALIPATHRGIASLGWVLSLGVTFILIATLVVLPAILQLVGGAMVRRRTREAGAARITLEPHLGSRAKRSGLLAILIVCVIAGVYGRAAAQTPDQNTASNSAVDQAEVLVRQAGESKPVDSQKIRAAIDKLHDALRMNPNNDSAYIDLGFCYSVLRDGPTAIDMYVKATRINPSGPNFKELADIYLRIGDPENALLAANAGITRDPRNASLYNAKGMALHDLGRIDEASTAFQKALELNPNFAVARANLRALNSGPRGRGSISKQEP